MKDEPNYKELGQRIRALLNEKRESLENDTDSLIPETGRIQDHYDLILGNMREGIVISRGDEVVYVNNTFKKITGYGLKELKNLDLNVAVHPDDLAEVKGIFKRRRNSFKPNSFSLRFFASNGALRWLDISTWHMHVGDDNCSIDFVDDITDKMEREIELKEYRRRLQLALEATSDGLWDISVTTGETWVNSRWFEMLGYEPGEFDISQSRWMDLVHPDDLDFVRKARIENNDGDMSYKEMEFRLRTKTGGYRWVFHGDGLSSGIQRDDRSE